MNFPGSFGESPESYGTRHGTKAAEIPSVGPPPGERTLSDVIRSLDKPCA